VRATKPGGGTAGSRGFLALGVMLERLELAAYFDLERDAAGGLRVLAI